MRTTFACMTSLDAICRSKSIEQRLNGVVGGLLSARRRIHLASCMRPAILLHTSGARMMFSGLWLRGRCWQSIQIELLVGLHIFRPIGAVGLPICQACAVFLSTHVRRRFRMMRGDLSVVAQVFSQIRRSIRRTSAVQFFGHRTICVGRTV